VSFFDDIPPSAPIKEKTKTAPAKEKTDESTKVAVKTKSKLKTLNSIQIGEIIGVLKKYHNGKYHWDMLLITPIINQLLDDTDLLKEDKNNE
jgi:hypothetical protein